MAEPTNYRASGTSPPEVKKPSAITGMFWPMPPLWRDLFADDPQTLGRVAVLLFEAAIYDGRHAGRRQLKVGQFHAASRKLQKILRMSPRDIPRLLFKLVTVGVIVQVEKGSGRGLGAVYQFTHFGKQPLPSMVVTDGPEPLSNYEDVVTAQVQAQPSESHPEPQKAVTVPFTVRRGPGNESENGNSRKKEEEPSGPLRGPLPDDLQSYVTTLLENVWSYPEEIDEQVPRIMAQVETMETAQVSGAMDLLDTTVKAAEKKTQYIPLAQVVDRWAELLEAEA